MTRKPHHNPNYGGARPGPHPGRPRAIERITIAAADARLLEAACDLDIPTALARIAAAAAADMGGTRAALAPLLAVAAWSEEIL